MGKGLSYLEELTVSSEAFGIDADGSKALTKGLVGLTPYLKPHLLTFIMLVGFS